MEESDSCGEEEREPKCEICGLKCKTLRILKRHLLRHSSDVHTCHICNKSFHDKYYLNRHVKNHRTENVCQYCGKKYANSRNLKRHEEWKHAASPKFVCNVCEQSCSSKQVLQAHMTKHGLVNTYKCDTCNRNFMYKSSLGRHMKTCKQTDVSAAKKFKCTCGKQFKTARLMRQHKNVHSEPKFSCHVCGKCFRWRKCLKYHLKSCEK